MIYFDERKLKLMKYKKKLKTENKRNKYFKLSLKIESNPEPEIVLMYKSNVMC